MEVFGKSLINPFRNHGKTENKKNKDSRLLLESLLQQAKLIKKIFGMYRANREREETCLGQAGKEGEPIWEG